LDGTKRVLAALAERGERIDHCLVGEPTSTADLADVVKNGRRGSLNAVVTVRGAQGHVAYPKLAKNPVSVLLDLLQHLRTEILDIGAPGFDPSNLEVTSIDVGNVAHNVIPATALARFNIRFNTRHDGASLTAFIERARARTALVHRTAEIGIDIAVTGEPFFTEAGPFTALVLDAAETVTGRRPALSTSGGTSDARFIKDHCPVVELGLCNATAHKVDEHVAVADVRALADIYTAILDRYFA
jgi:succinyl-diaminopimelate desuccinylase